MSKMRHIFGFSRNARRHFQNAQEGVPDAPFSRNCARSGSTATERRLPPQCPGKGGEKKKEAEEEQLSRDVQ